MKYVDILFFAASIPIDTAKLVLPTPGVPQKIMF